MCHCVYEFLQLFLRLFLLFIYVLLFGLSCFINIIFKMPVCILMRERKKGRKERRRKGKKEERKEGRA